MFCMKIKKFGFFKDQTPLVPNKAFCFKAPNSSSPQSNQKASFQKKPVASGLK